MSRLRGSVLSVVLFGAAFHGLLTPSAGASARSGTTRTVMARTLTDTQRSEVQFVRAHLLVNGRPVSEAQAVALVEQHPGLIPCAPLRSRAKVIRKQAIANTASGHTWLNWTWSGNGEIWYDQTIGWWWNLGDNNVWSTEVGAGGPGIAWWAAAVWRFSGIVGNPGWSSGYDPCGDIFYRQFNFDVEWQTGYGPLTYTWIWHLWERAEANGAGVGGGDN